MYVLVILDTWGNEMSRVPCPPFLPPVGSTVTSHDGTFVVVEVAIDMTKQEVVVYSKEYDLPVYF